MLCGIASAWPGTAAPLDPGCGRLRPQTPEKLRSGRAWASPGMRSEKGALLQGRRLGRPFGVWWFMDDREGPGDRSGPGGAAVFGGPGGLRPPGPAKPKQGQRALRAPCPCFVRAARARRPPGALRKIGFPFIRGRRNGRRRYGRSHGNHGPPRGHGRDGRTGPGGHRPAARPTDPLPPGPRPPSRRRTG